MAKSDARYFVDRLGRKRAILLDIAEYTRLMRRLEELEDALDLDEAVRTGQGFRELTAVRGDLRREGRL